jgi:SAM-dependent methyltransferase
VGCGTGNSALALARRAGWVSGFDISPKMIGHARENAIVDGATNADFRVLDWDTTDLAALGWEKSFDLVLASRTPAISDKAGLDKMIAASKDACLIVTMAESRNSVREKLMPLVGWDEEEARARRPFYCAFNLLWLMGYCPEVTYVDHAWEAEYSLEDSLLMHRHSFENLRPLTAEQTRVITEELGREAVDGMVRERVASKLAVMFWKV